MKKLALGLVIGGLVVTGMAGPVAAETGPNQTFTVVKIGANSGVVAGAGVINGVGVENNNRLQVPRGAQFQAVFSFPEGDLLQTATPVSAQSQFDPVACVTRTAIHSTFAITGGTNGLAGASGGGEANSNTTAIGSRGSDGACLGPDTPPVFLISVVQLTATVSVG